MPIETSEGAVSAVSPDVISKPHVPWLSCYEASGGEMKVALRSDEPGFNEPVMLSQRFHDISSIDRECIVAVKWLKAFSVGVMGPSNGTANFQRAYLLEALDPHASEVEVFHRLAAWKTLASLSGLKIRTNRGDDETDAVIERADLNRPLLEEALALRNFWPLGFLSLDGPARALLLEQAAMENDALSELSNAHPDEAADVHVLSTSVEVDAVAAAPSSQEPKETDFEQSDDPAANNMNDCLHGDLDAQVIAGIHPPLFVTQGHHLRQGTPWSVVLTFPQKRRGRPGYDALICSLADPHRYANDTTCVLRPGKPGEGSETSTPEVRLWKVVAACFGLNAVSNVSQPVEPFTHERTRRLIRKYGDLVLSAIEAWPVIGHEHLKPIARKRALAVLGQSSMPQRRPVESIKQWPHLSTTDSPEETGVLGIKIDLPVPSTSEDSICTPASESTERAQSKSAISPESAPATYVQARASLNERLSASRAALLLKQEQLEQLTKQIEADRTAVTNQEAQLARIDGLIRSLDLALREI